MHKKPSFSFKTVSLMLLYWLIQWSWGFIQTFVGFILFLIFIKEPHDFYHGAIRTKWPTLDGISLGLFIFTPNDESTELLTPTGRHKKELSERCQRISVHEFGHTIQSIILGPFYLLTIGLISFTWARLPRYKRLRRQYGVPYSFAWPEQWADSLGEAILKQRALR